MTMRFTEISTTSSDEVFALDADGQLWRYYWGPVTPQPDGTVKAERLWEKVALPDTATWAPGLR